MTLKSKRSFSRPFVGCALGLALLLHGFGLRPMMVQGSSMWPALTSGEVRLLDRDYYESHPLRRGDVVVFQWHGCTYVKRIFALPGENVSLVYDQGDCWALSPDYAARYGPRLGRIPHVKLRSRVV